MYKSLFVILCLLVGAMPIRAQKRAPQPRLPSPDVQRIFDKIRAMTPEQRARLREIALTVLDERHAREQRAGPTPDQHSWAPPPLGGFPDFTLDPNLRKYGPLGPNVKYGPLGPLGEGQGPQQSGNVQPNPGIVLNLPEGFTHPLDGVSKSLEGFDLNLDLDLDGFNERIEAATNGAIRALNLLQEQIAAASNQPPVPRLVDQKVTRPRSASVASVRSAGPLPSDDTPAGKATAARARGGTVINLYNSPLPASTHRIGNRARNPSTKDNPKTKGIWFGIKPNTVLYDSRGNPRGEIDLSIPGRTNRTQLSYGGERMIRLPSGELKRAYDAFAVYLMNGELASGLILEEDFNVKPRMPSLMPPKPPDQGHDKYMITGGDRNAAPWKVDGVTLKVNSKYTEPGQSSTDYGWRDGGFVNMCYSVPGTVSGGGGQCYDTFKVGATFFYREKSVAAIPAKLYKPGAAVPVPGVQLTFLYGFVNTPTGKRYGWMAEEALLKK